MKVAKDLVVSLAYQVRTEDGVLVDESPVSAPLDYLHGHGSLISGLENALDEVQKEKIWLNSGGFIVIQQTEAFVSIDVNSGKFTGKKKAEETYRKINLEAAKEISRQLRLRNLSGIILIDFINMTNPDHNDELFHVLQKYLRKDPVKCKAIDITPLHILEMTRKKVRKPVIEEIRQIKSGDFSNTF